MMDYPLKEKIGYPDLLVGRQREFTNFGAWIENIPRELSKSRVILARRKSGKTALVQRFFNQLWQANGEVIPIYYHMEENRVWYTKFAIDYYRTFASQYISFLERDMALVREPLTLDEIKAYGERQGIKSFIRDVDFIESELRTPGPDLIWKMAYGAPHRFAGVYDKRFLVIIDEFQYLASTIYRDEACERVLIESIPGSFHSVVESKIAPMLVTGSYIGWLTAIASRYLEAGRLSQWYMPPSLTEDEGLQAVYKYAEVYRQPITNESALLINELCAADPFFISCVVQSFYEGKDLTTVEGVINTVNYEITDYKSEMSMTWGEYIDRSLSKINDLNSKRMLLYLSKHNEQDWTTHQVREILDLDLTAQEIKAKLQLMVEADLLKRGGSDIRYQGLTDGTLYLILRHRFEEEITSFQPDIRAGFQVQLEALRQDKRRLQGQLNNLQGHVAEYQLATKFRSQKRFALSDYFKGVGDTHRLNIIEARTRLTQQRADGKSQELDVVARSSDGRVVLVEVKKWQTPIGAQVVEDFWEKVQVYQHEHPEHPLLPAILALGGFTEAAQDMCQQHGIATAQQIEWL